VDYYLKNVLSKIAFEVNLTPTLTPTRTSSCPSPSSRRWKRRCHASSCQYLL